MFHVGEPNLLGLLCVGRSIGICTATSFTKSAGEPLLQRIHHIIPVIFVYIKDLKYEHNSHRLVRFPPDFF